MKTYENESLFVNNFAKDAKEGIKSNGNFEAEVNGIQVVIAGMDNNNASKVTVYSGTVDGVSFSGSITALKKKLNVTYTKDYNRSVDGTTKVSIKSDEELSRTADTACRRVRFAVETINKYANLYAIPFDVLVTDGYDYFDEEGQKVHTTAYDLIFDALKAKRDNEVERRANEAKRKAEEAAKKLADEKTKLEKQLAELQAKLAKM